MAMHVVYEFTQTISRCGGGRAWLWRGRIRARHFFDTRVTDFWTVVSSLLGHKYSFLECKQSLVVSYTSEPLYFVDFRVVVSAGE